ncbi:MAG TPA: PadR family transcriptional regulator [Allosphingosinicella sp.]|jgi:DNA-binding PadR family transcriptional regulator
MIRTELEYCALGVIWRRGPCSAYEVRSEFARSPSAFWSASAGSIYPVVGRLVAARLVAATERQVGRRKSKLLELTDSGLAALRSWICTLDRASTAATYDPIRTRFSFLDAVPDPERRDAVIATALAETRARLDELCAEEQGLGGAAHDMERIAMRGARRELEARIAWLGEARAPLVGRR